MASVARSSTLIRSSAALLRSSRPTGHARRHAGTSYVQMASSRWASIDTKQSALSTPFASLPPEPPRGMRPRVRTTFLILTLLAVAVTGAGLYTFYGSFTTWPAELRDDLRAAVKAQRRGEWAKAEARFRKALETARTLPSERLGSDALLKVSGISIALGAVLEQNGDLRKAYDVHAEALQDVQALGRTPEERLRAVALAQRCGDLASIKEVRDSFSISSDQTPRAEEHLRWSVEELLRLAVPEETRQQILQGKQEALLLSDLELPNWVSDITLGAALEALGQQYAAQGKASYAVPLYLQAINILMPSDKEKRKHNPTVAERCRAGILMNNVAQLMVDAQEGKPAKVDDAQAWAMRGLDIVTFALRGTGWDQKGGQGFKNVEQSDDRRTGEVKGQCWTAEVALLINLGELARMKKDDCKARELFQRAYVRADVYGMREARSRCAQALSELERTTRSQPGAA